MSDDDFVGGIIPDATGDDDFDPNTIESDDFLDDEGEDVLPEEDDTLIGAIPDSDDEDDEDEDDALFGDELAA